MSGFHDVGDQSFVKIVDLSWKSKPLIKTIVIFEIKPGTTNACNTYISF